MSDTCFRKILFSQQKGTMREGINAGIWGNGKDGRKVQHQGGAEVTADAGRGKRGEGGEVDCMRS